MTSKDQQPPPGLVFEMHEAGMAMVRSRLARENPSASSGELDDLVSEWLNDRPMDAPGRLRDL